ncbi:MAG TPA: pilus assembly protein N-terminal domain-containing protein [Tepidisphaeraceae bacterium]|nr:pilus assembly protein N-terminal domain-containing protein [Tepidisphaeraceae bacterium]
MRQNLRVKNNRVGSGIAVTGAALLIGFCFCTTAPGQATQPSRDPTEIQPPVDARPDSANTGPSTATVQQADVQQTVQLYSGQTQSIDAPWPVKQITIDQPQIGDIQMTSPERVRVQAKAPGSAELVMSSADGDIWRARLVVVPDLRGLQGHLTKLFPRASLQVEQVGDIVVVRGILPRAEEAAQLRQFLHALRLNAMDMTTVAGVQQVQLQVRVAEVSRSALRTLGINALHTGNDFFGGIPIGSSAGPLVPVNIGVPSGTPAASNLPFQFLDDVNVPSAVTLFGGFPDADLQVFIQALAENQYLRLLAEPNLVALSGEEATFLAGGEFPIPVVQGTGGDGGVSVEFKEFGVRLAFRPTVMGDGNIRLLVAPEVSELSDVGAVDIQGFRIPSVVTRRVQTTIELKSGQTFGMAGLINRTTGARTSRVPGLGNLPVLGALFRSVRYSRNDTELVVLVTANLVEPLSVPMSHLPVPGIQHRAPSAWELYALGRIEGESPAKVSPRHSAELKRLGLDKLRGPGAWATYDRRRANAHQASPAGGPAASAQ